MNQMVSLHLEGKNIPITMHLEKETGLGFPLMKVEEVIQGLGFHSPPCHILLVDVLGLLAADVVEEAECG